LKLFRLLLGAAIAASVVLCVAASAASASAPTGGVVSCDYMQNQTMFESTLTMPAPTYSWHCSVRAVDDPGYTGWIYGIGALDGSPMAPPAYRWTASGWQRASIDGQTLETAQFDSAQGSHVIYRAPFSATWSWIWDAKDGWLATPSLALTLPATAADWARAERTPTCSNAWPYECNYKLLGSPVPQA
jgi:hypothetical protein